MAAKRPAWESGPRVPEAGARPLQGSQGSERTVPDPISTNSLADLLEFARRLALAQGRPAEFHRLLRSIAEGVSSLLSSNSAAVLLFEPKEELLRFELGIGLLARHEGEVVPSESEFEGASLRAGEVLAANELRSDPRSYRARERGIEVGPALAVPLRTEEATYGVLLIGRAAGEDLFTPAEQALVGQAAEFARAAIASALQFDRVRASRDAAEDWRNQQLLQRRIAQYENWAAEQNTAVMEWDTARDRLVWGGELVRWAGVAPEAMRGSLSTFLEHVNVKDRAAVQQAFEAARGGEDQEVEVRLAGSEGAAKRLVLRLEAAAAAVPQVVRGVLRAEDARKGVGSTALPSSEGEGLQVRQLIRALRHEINNPLAVIMGQAQLLRQEPALKADPLLQQSVQTIFEETRRVDALAQRLARLEQAPYDVEFSETGAILFPPESDEE